MIKRKRSDFENSCIAIKDINEKLAKLLEIKEKYQNLLSEYSSRFISCYKLEEFNTKILLLEEDLEKLKSFDNELKYLCEINSDTKLQCANLSAKLAEVANKFCEFKDQYDFDSRFIYYVNIKNKHKKKYLGFYDTKLKKWNRVALNLDIKAYSGSCFCQLPNSELFFYYENREDKSGICCIIDLKSLSIKRFLPSISNHTFPACAYYENCIYLFAADYRQNFSFKFNFLQNKWFPLSSFSHINASTCLEIFKKSILFVGNFNSIYKYDLEIESYSRINSDSWSWSWDNKGIFSLGSRLYIFETKQFIYESEIDNEYVWQRIGKCDYSFYESPFKKFNGDSIFLIMSYRLGHQFYKFDLKSKSFNKLKVIKY